MKAIVLAIIFFAGSVASAATLGSIDDARKLVTSTMAKVNAGDFRGGLELMKPYSVVPDAEMEVAIQQSVAQLPVISGRFGKSLGFEILKEQDAGPFLHRIIVLHRFEKHALRWTFLFYRRGNAWFLNSFFFDDELANLFDP